MITQVNIPNKIEKNYNELISINENAVAALIAYKDYADGYKSLGNIADDLSISKMSLVDIYERARLPIILYSKEEFQDELGDIGIINIVEQIKEKRKCYSVDLLDSLLDIVK